MTSPFITQMQELLDLITHAESDEERYRHERAMQDLLAQHDCKHRAPHDFKQAQTGERDDV
jgi:hypothetical protein